MVFGRSGLHFVRELERNGRFWYFGVCGSLSDVGAFRSNYWKLEWFLKAVRLAVEHAIETGGVYDFLCHPSCMLVEDPGFETVKLICQLVKDAGDKAEIVGLSKIAERVKEAT